MPVLRIELNRQVSEEAAKSAIAKTRKAIHDVKGDPESMISVSVLTSIAGAFGVSTSEPAANLQLTSFGLVPEVTSELTRRFSQILWEELDVSADRAYIIFTNVAEPHLTSWSGRTFAEIMLQQMGGREELQRRVRGRLVSNRLDPKTKGRIPLGGLHIELWELDPSSSPTQPSTDGSTARYLGNCQSAAEGYFEIYFKRLQQPADPPSILTLRVYDPDQLVVIKGRSAKRRFLIAQQPVSLSTSFPPQSDDGAFDLTVGMVKIEFYEYDRAWAFPYAVPGSIRIGFSSLQAGRYAESEKGSTEVGLILLGRLESSPDGLPVDDIQRALAPQSPTLLMEKDNPGSSRNDAFFAHRLLNCFVPPLFRIDQTCTNPDSSEDSRIFVLDYNWKNFQRRTDLSLLSFRVRFTNDRKRLRPVDISIGLNNEDDPLKFTRFLPKDGDNWLAAKRLVRAHHHNVIAQFQGHLAFTHFNLEQYAVAFMRSIRLNPLRNLLFPFVREVMAINEKGRSTLVGGQDITGQIEPMKPGSLQKWISDSIGRQDWKDWKPRQPICEGHDYAYAAHHYWSLLTDFVDNYFARFDWQIRTCWTEVLAFSNDLVSHSPAFVGVGMEEATSDPWYCMNEISERGRDGKPAIQSLTQVDSNPSDVDVDNLKQVCRYVIFHATFFHSWAHAFMMTDLGELKYSGMVRNGGLGTEEDESVLAEPLEAMYALGSTATLSSMNCGYMIQNEDGDASTELISAIQKQKDKFASWNFDISKLCARLNT